MPSMSGDKFAPPPRSARPMRGQMYWRSLNDVAGKPEFREFVHREFPEHASEWLDEKGQPGEDQSGDGRRTFLKVMGASLALAGLASCRRWPEEKLTPYAHRPPGRMDGVPVHYATAFERGGMGQGVVAVSFDGRPIKVDGNPGHPLTRGASDMFLQASVLDVYDPDRSRGPVLRTGGTGGKRAEKAWAEFETVVKGIDKATLVVLSEASRSPTVARLRGELVKAGAKWFEYEAISGDNQREGARQYFGRPLRAVPQLDKANVILSLDADLFHGEPLAIKFNRDFALGRKLRDSAKAGNAQMNRLYVVESGFSITGSMADHRLPQRPRGIGTIVAALAAFLSGGALNYRVSAEIQPYLDAVVKDLKANQGKAVVVAGWRQPAEVHAAVAAINAMINAPVDYYAEPEDPRGEDGWKGHEQQLVDFAHAVTAAKTVVILGANVVLTAPVSLHLAELLAGKGQVKPDTLTIHVGTYEDETAQACQWHVPLAHYLEAWGDVRTFEGSVTVAQPLIEPIFGAKSAVEMLAMLLGKKTDGFEQVRATAKNDYMKSGFSEWAWKKALFEGVVADTARKPEAAVRNAGKEADVAAALAKLPTGSGMELALYAGAAYDGRFANNGWLIELPDPMTRVSWENPLLMSPTTAKKLGLDSDDVVVVSTAGNKDGIEAVVYVLAGQPDEVLSLAVGYGRDKVGNVADGTGVNAYALRATGEMFLRDVTLTKVGDKTKLVACVQDHHVIDKVGKDRLNTIVPELVVEGTLEQYKKKAALGTRKIVALSIFDEYKYDQGQPWVMAKWGMAIDLTTCTGCSACVVACQAENNIPVVGRQMVYRGREMHWLRIDRYYKFGRDEGGRVLDGRGGHEMEANEVQVVHQPVLCQHCENAPCESVCPVAATTHSHEGLNMMTYNRCIGTRYCSNNCPYKVRRFNFFDYNSGTNFGEHENLYTPNLLRRDLNELVKMQKNPQVTVRSRGVMEKCTYCVQRIEAARIDLLAQNRQAADKASFKDGTVVTACQQACPADAIAFGDLNDKDSRVAKLHALAQGYKLLDPELNTKPRTQYLAKVRNNVPGLDETLYNEHTATEGWFFEKGEPAMKMEGGHE
jgi:MoCo/4Fe-4S cofactor protein with predicted Tat translocation signal